MSTLPILIDTHCHLDHDYSPKTTSEVIHEAHQAGIARLITIGTSLDSIPTIQKISDEHPHVFHTLGIHPHDVAGAPEDTISRLEFSAKHPKCRAVGEIGLDYHYEHSPRNIQIEFLEKQLDLALRLNLPVVIHSREGESDLLHALTRYSKNVRNIPDRNIPGVIHCFSGTLGFGKACLDLGFYLSFSGILTFKKAEEVQQAAREFPLDRILVETDAPFLAPIPYRGKKCEPWMVRLTAEKLAEIKGLPLETVARTTTENAAKVFGLSL